MQNLVNDLCAVFMVLVMVTGKIPAQLPDGTRTTQQWINEIIANYDEEENTVFNEGMVYNYSQIQLHPFIIKDPAGEANCTGEQIIAAVNNLNRYFQPVNMVFSLQPVQYINDYNYGYITGDAEPATWASLYGREKSISLFLVESIRIDDTARYGFTYFPVDSEKNYIFLDKEFIDGNFLVTLMGHFFGLLSTHDTLGGYELVERINCLESGDFLCDTWADPGLFEKVSKDCAYLGWDRDPGGRYYVPSVANLMSDSFDACKCIYTEQQYRRMLYYAQKYRHYLR